MTIPEATVFFTDSLIFNDGVEQFTAPARVSGDTVYMPNDHILPKIGQAVTVSQYGTGNLRMCVVTDIQRRPPVAALTVTDRTIPDIEGDPRESGRRNRAALRYLHQCGFLRVEPDKHRIEAILLGRDKN